MVEAAPQARPEDHLGGTLRSSFVAGYHLGLTSALQHCQHNGAFRFLAAQVFSDFGLILGPHFESLLSSDWLNPVFFWSLFPGHLLHRFLMELLTAGALKTRFSHEKYYKINFSGKSFLMSFGVDRCRFLEVLGTVFLVF